MTHHIAIFATAAGAGFAPQFWWWIVVWIAFMGAFFGSFMNVVVYRLPRGKPLAFPGSACPACGHAVRWFDNVPVQSWLLLGARCRDCRTPISGRYPLVEAVVGAMFVWLVLAEVYSGGATLPAAHLVAGVKMHLVPGARPTAAYDGALWLSFAYRLLMMCTLLCAALIEYDRRCPPLKLYWPALFVGLVLPLWRPMARPIPAWATGETLGTASLDGLLGLAVGLFVGLLLAIGARNLNGVLAAPLNMALVGVFLGWQAATCVAAVTAIVVIVVDQITRRLPDSIILFGLTFLFMLNWGTLAEQVPELLSPHVGNTQTAFVWAVIFVAGALRALLNVVIEKMTRWGRVTILISAISAFWFPVVLAELSGIETEGCIAIATYLSVLGALGLILSAIGIMRGMWREGLVAMLLSLTGLYWLLITVRGADEYGDGPFAEECRRWGIPVEPHAFIIRDE